MRHFDYTRALATARLLLERAEIHAITHPDEPAAMKRLHRALRRYREVLDNPGGRPIGAARKPNSEAKS
jgi:hypothetical protein